MLKSSLSSFLFAALLAACSQAETPQTQKPAPQITEAAQPQAGPVSCAVQNTVGASIDVAGGEFQMGDERYYRDEGPVFSQSLAPFSIDKTEVTNGQFRIFAQETGYKTKAERGLDDDEFPELPAELRVPGSSLFIPPSKLTPSGWWDFVAGASWKTPKGPDSDIDGKDFYPVVHIAYEDALAYANWAGRDLPSEAQWEFAARGGLSGAAFAWGEEEPTKGQSKANTWQGLFPYKDNANDGFAGIAPVGCFPPNGYGVHDMTGNVWEWTSTDYTADRSKGDAPKGGHDPSQPGVPVKVMKGGSFLCAENFCYRFRPAARHPQDISLGTNHIGFRTVARAAGG